MRPLGRRPGIQTRIPCCWIPGSRRRGAPRNDWSWFRVRRSATPRNDGHIVIPGCALLGADPESRQEYRVAGFRVRAEEARPGMTGVGSGFAAPRRPGMTGISSFRDAPSWAQTRNPDKNTVLLDSGFAPKRRAPE